MNINITSTEIVYGKDAEGQDVVQRVSVRYNGKFGENNYINGAIDITKEEYEANPSVSALKVIVVNALRASFS